jgi:hypothetical protein
MIVFSPDFWFPTVFFKDMLHILNTGIGMFIQQL